MAHTTETFNGGLLWLRPAASCGSVGTIVALEKMLADSVRPVQTVSDVHHALLYLTRDGASAYLAAIVCVDEMEPAELEFFTLLPPQHDCPPVYVYGHERSLSKLGRAIELGATGEASHEIVQQLTRRETTPMQGDINVGEVPVVTTAMESPAAPWESIGQPDEMGPVLINEAGDVERTDVAPPDGERSEPGPSDGDEESVDVEDDTEDDTDAPIRVPWRSYDDAGRRPPPRRSPPQRTPPHADDADASWSGPEAYEPGPLLSEEELRALIGDDNTATDGTDTDTHGS